MAKLHIIYDPVTRSFVGASVGGKFLYGVASVVLSKDSLSVLDYEGRDLLADPKSVGCAPDHSRAAADIAAAFGVNPPAPTNHAEPVETFDERVREPRR